MKAFERQLPESYEEALVIDAKNKKVGIIFNISAVSVMIVISVIAFLLLKPYEDSFKPYFLIGYFAAMLVYVVLHELLHGLAYKLLTRQKLSFGLTASVAYCGVPDIYVYRRTALISLLAPFTVLSVALAIPLFFPMNLYAKFFISILLGYHVGGCVGDLYDTGLLLFKLKSPDTLMRDTGPTQIFYVKKEISRI